MRLLSDKKSMALGVIFTYVSLGVSIIGSYAITPIVLNNIGDANYGLLSFCNSITSWLSLVSTSLGTSYIYFANKSIKEKGDEKSTNTLFREILFSISGIVAFISLSAVLLMKFGGIKFSNYTNEQNDIILILLFISGTNVAVTIFFSVYGLYNNFKNSFAYVRGVQIVFSILSYLANLILAVKTKSIIAIAAVSLFSAAITGLLNLFYAIRAKNMLFERKGNAENRNIIPSIVRYSSIILITNIIGNLDSNLDKTLLGVMVNAESVTLYHLSITFAYHLTVLAYSFIEVMRPTIYSYYREGRTDDVNNLFLKISKMQSVVVLLIIGGYISCGYHLVMSWIGSDRIEVYFYTMVLFVSSIVPLTNASMGEAYRATYKHKKSLHFSILSISVNLFLSIGLLLTLDKKLSIWACIIGTVVPRVIFSHIISPLYAHKILKYPTPQYYVNICKNVIITIVALIPSIIIMLFLNDSTMHSFLKAIIEGLFFATIYIVGIIIFEKETIIGIFNNFMKKNI